MSLAKPTTGVRSPKARSRWLRATKLHALPTIRLLGERQAAYRPCSHVGLARAQTSSATHQNQIISSTNAIAFPAELTNELGRRCAGRKIGIVASVNNPHVATDSQVSPRLHVFAAAKHHVQPSAPSRYPTV